MIKIGPQSQLILKRVLMASSLLFWAAVIIYFYQSGRMVKYVSPDFRLIALAGGLGLAVLGLFNLLTANREADCGHYHSVDDTNDHETGDMSSLSTFLLMTLPVALSVIWTTDSFSQATLARKGLYDDPNATTPNFLASSFPVPTLDQLETTHPKTSDGYHPFSLMELFFATGDRELQGVMNGLKVETEGRIVAEKNSNPNGTRMRLYRLFMTCCVADSQAIPIILEFGKNPPALSDNSWVKIAGTMTYPEENGTLKAILTVDRADPAEAPMEEKFLRN